MSELTPEYEGRITFTIVSAEDTKNARDEIEAYLLAPRGHGLVAFTATGEPVVAIAGHQFGREEIEMAIQQVIAP